MIKCSEVYTEDLVFAGTRATIIHAIESTLSGGSYDINENLHDILVTNADATEIEYLLNRQDRYLSPLFVRILAHNPDEEDHLINVSQKLANIILNRFLIGWSKLADAVFADYNPIDNYNMVEQKETDFEEHTVTDNDETVKQKYAGFNASTPSDVSESVTDGTIDTTKTDTGSKAKNELTRRGNIGVTTSQQMIESEYNLRRKNFLDLIYKDIDSILFIDYYC